MPGIHPGMASPKSREMKGRNTMDTIVKVIECQDGTNIYCTATERMLVAGRTGVKSFNFGEVTLAGGMKADVERLVGSEARGLKWERRVKVGW